MIFLFLKWWPISESNQGHSDFQSLALPTELIGHLCVKSLKKWWPISESNQGHSDFQSLALPTELIGHLLRGRNFTYNVLKVSLYYFSGIDHLR
jgi:hypothetical protein